jgi:hypothetical protein
MPVTFAQICRSVSSPLAPLLDIPTNTGKVTDIEIKFTEALIGYYDTADHITQIKAHQKGQTLTTWDYA